MTHVRKPEWLKVSIGGARCGKVGRILNRYELNTVCEQAGCPNKGECFKGGTAAFMLLGNQCTRNCSFCQVTQGIPLPADPNEPDNVARAVVELGLRHVVVTSVTRDDLPDGGAEHFAATVENIRKRSADTIVEVLIPDFQGDTTSLKKVLNAEPHILNHNVETIPELYATVRPKAVFDRSIALLRQAKVYAPKIITKSGFMLGLGEKKEQVISLLMALRCIKCDMVTIGQYLPPSKEHCPVKEYVPPHQFDEYKSIALTLGIPCVSSGPLVRSSYHAEQDYKYIEQANIALSIETGI